MNKKTIVILFAVLLGGLALGNLFWPTRVFSENENRYLKQFPSFSAEALRSGKYTADIDDFVTDQFILRDAWVGLKTLSEAALQKKSANGVYFGKAGYLIEMFDSVDLEQYQKNLDVVAAFSERIAQESNISVSTLLIPSASMILTDKLPAHTPEIDQQALIEQAAKEIPGFVDLSGTLRAHSDEAIYYHTDHHWTSLGAFYAYADWREQRGETPPGLDDYDQELLSETFYGTTYSKARFYTTPADDLIGFLPKDAGTLRVSYNEGEEISDSIYAREYLDTKDKYSVFLNANQPITQITTENQNGRRLLIVKDSYGNSFAQMALRDYEEVYLIDLRYFKMSVREFAEQNGITDLLILYSIKNFSTDTNLYYLST